MDYQVIIDLLGQLGFSEEPLADEEWYDETGYGLIIQNADYSTVQNPSTKVRRWHFSGMRYPLYKSKEEPRNGNLFNESMYFANAKELLGILIVCQYPPALVYERRIKIKKALR